VCHGGITIPFLLNSAHAIAHFFRSSFRLLPLSI
jgi:hypothetical protein